MRNHKDSPFALSTTYRSFSRICILLRAVGCRYSRLTTPTALSMALNNKWDVIAATLSSLEEFHEGGAVKAKAIKKLFKSMTQDFVETWDEGEHIGGRRTGDDEEVRRGLDDLSADADEVQEKDARAQGGAARESNQAVRAARCAGGAIVENPMFDGFSPALLLIGVFATFSHHVRCRTVRRQPMPALRAINHQRDLALAALDVSEMSLPFGISTHLKVHGWMLHWFHWPPPGDF